MPHGITEDGFEQTFQVNYLAHVYLVQLLQDALVSSAPSRVVLLSSEGHRMASLNKGNISWENLSPSSPKKFLSFVTYLDSKICMSLAARLMARLYKDRNVKVYSCCPGAVYTSISRNWWPFKLMMTLIKPFIKSPVISPPIHFLVYSRSKFTFSIFFHRSKVQPPRYIVPLPRSWTASRVRISATVAHASRHWWPRTTKWPRDSGQLPKKC